MDWENRTVSLLLCLSILLATIHNGNAERKIVCYYTNWSIYRPGTAKFSPQNINPYLCTHLIYAFGGFTKDNALKPFDKYQDIEKGGYAKFTGLKTYNKNLKTLLAIGGWNEGSSRFSPMVADAGRRREFVKNAIKFLRKNHFDGLDLDWEYPAFRDGGKPRDKDNYANLVQELREEFEREASKTGRPRLLLTLAMPAGIEYIDKGYDIPRLNEYLDFINLLSYDYHSSYEPAVNHHAPLYPLEEDNEYNYDTELTIDYTVNYLLKKGASSDKIILGIPTYGRSYTLFNQDATDLGSPADGPGIEGDATREKGYLAYYEICESLAQSDEWEVVEPNPDAMGPYAFKGDQWVGYDDEDIVRLKARYVNEKKLGGIMFWTIDNDDFRGKCHDRPYPLIEAAKETLLSDATDAVRKSKPVEGRKKSRIQGTRSDAERRKNGGRGGTTATPVSKNRVPTSSRPRYRTFTRPRASEPDEEEGGRVDRRSYDPASEDEERQGREEEEENSERGNAVSGANKRERSRDGKKSRGGKNRSSSSRNRRKQVRRKEERNNGLDSKEESLSNKLTTPEPPTTPDPGTDFKCEDEGFFSHPRDCKKYFWCLDSGPGGLGVVAHQFTCPSGLVFNKAADSCDYPRNVACPKSKTPSSSASTTRAPITAATSRTTYLYSTTTRRPSTAKPDPEEEYEYYEDEDEEEEEGEEEEEKEEAKMTSTPKTLLYKTITRNNKPSTTSTTTTTTTTTTEAAFTTSKSIDSEDEEDPKVIKELITLIKKAGGIEQLEKQLLLQDKNSNESSANSGGETATPATISRSLYERVLNRQAGKVTSRQRSSTNTNFANGPGRAQFEGLEEVPEVKGLRRSQKPKYVTIERPKHSTKEPPLDGEEVEEEEEDLDGDNTDVASSEEQTISNPFLTGSTQRATPNYIDIRRPRPSTSRKEENDVEEKSKDGGEGEAPIRRRRPSNTKTSSTENVRDEESRSSTSEENSQTTKSRYVSVQRFRSTTPQTTEAVSEIVASTTESIEPSKIGDEKIDTTTSPLTNTLPWIGSSSTPNDDIIPVETEAGRTEEAETERAILSTTSESSSTTDSVKLVEDSVTEILLTTAPASLSTLSIPNTRISTASVSQPRPFGFNRRNRPSSTEPTTTTTTVTTPLPPSNDQTRSKVANTEVNRLPTLKELIGYQTNNYIATGPSSVFLNLSPLAAKSEEVMSHEKNIDRVLEEVIIEKNTIFNDTELRSWNKHDDGIENDFQSDLTVDGVNAYYVEDDTSFANKKRIDREDSSEINLKPTTIRGIPLINLLHNQVSRGFYVTRSEMEHSTSKRVKIDALTTEFTTLSVETNETISSGISSEKVGQPDIDGKVITDLEHDKNTEKNLESDVTTTFNTKLSMKNNRDGTRVEGRVESTSVSTDQVQIEKDVSSIIKFTEISIPEENVTNSSISISLTDSSPSMLTSQSSNESEIINSTTEKSITNDHNTPSILNIVIPITTIPSDITTDTNLLESNVTELCMENTTHSADLENSYSINCQNAGKSTKNDEEFKSTLSTTTLSSTNTVETSITDTTINVFNNHDEKSKFTSNYEFGHKFRRRGQNRYHVNRLNKDQENSTKVVERTQNSRRKIIGYRRPLRRPVSNGKAANDSFVYEVTTLKETKVNDSVRNVNDWKDMNKEETNVEKKLISKANQTGNEAVFDEEHLRIKENIDRSKSEVNSSKNTVTSRTPGNLSSTRLRKPTAFTLTPLQSKTTQQNTFANHRKTHLTDGKLQTVVNETLDTVDERTETSKPEKDIDQNSRAQEIAVTLADPPSVQSSTTGRPSLRNALKRKISTTVAPRTDATTSRASLRFTPALSDRQKPRTKDDKTRRNSTTTTTRPRQRPPVVDYDYYEDEEEPVIGRSTFNGKLFLTSKGTFRCLDQGNFPHPYSCKKFVTCARMVNGLVIGAEYTCPDRLSFDPVGGICNWSAGLGCKE